MTAFTPQPQSIIAHNKELYKYTTCLLTYCINSRRWWRWGNGARDGYLCVLYRVDTFTTRTSRSSVRSVPSHSASLARWPFTGLHTRILTAPTTHHAALIISLSGHFSVNLVLCWFSALHQKISGLEFCHLRHPTVSANALYFKAVPLSCSSVRPVRHCYHDISWTA